MATASLESIFQAALAHHHAGRLFEAERLYRQILVAAPDHAHALHMLGILAQHGGQGAMAVELLQKAVALAPTVASFHSNLGETLSQLGRLDEAVGALQCALEIQPDYALACSNLGTVFLKQDRLAEAEAMLRRAIALRPDSAVAHRHLGAVLRRVGRLEEAVTACRRALEIQPESAPAHSILGLMLVEQGRPVEGEAVLRRALALQPHFAEAYCNLGMALRDQRRWAEAIAAYGQALQLQPDLPEVHNNLGVALLEQGAVVEADCEFRRAIALEHGAVAHLNLGNALRQQGRLDEALASYRRAVALEPGYAEAHSILGDALREVGDFGEAVAACRRATALQPEHAGAAHNLGLALCAQDHFVEGEAALRRATELKPDYHQVKYNHAVLLLRRGDFTRGWPLYESRMEVGGYQSLRQDSPLPTWRGEPLRGDTVLVHAEQGFGDTLQFVRYAPLIAQRGGRVVVECQPELKRLLMGMDGIAAVITSEGPLPACEWRCPVMSLPLVFDTCLETIPAAAAYLRAPPAEVAQWQARLSDALGARKAPLKVGLVWAGDARLQWRSLGLRQFAPLTSVPGAVFISLQKGAPAGEARTPPAGMTLFDWTEELHDFAATAALIECLDLVISVDTAVAHVAGGLGKSVWLLNRFNACWRWLVDREDTPWYPTMRLFRQPKFDDWPAVIARVAEELTTFAAQRG